MQPVTNIAYILRMILNKSYNAYTTVTAIKATNCYRCNRPTLQLTSGASIWFEIWGGRGSGFENWGLVGPKSSTDGDM